MRQKTLFLIPILLLFTIILGGCTINMKTTIKVNGWDEKKFILGEFDVKSSSYNYDTMEFVIINEQEFLNKIEKDLRYIDKVKLKNMYSIYNDNYLFYEKDNYYYIVKHPTNENQYHLESCTANLIKDGFIYKFPLFLYSFSNENNFSVENDKSWDFYVEFYGRVDKDIVTINHDAKTITIKSYMQKEDYTGIGLSEIQNIKLIWSESLLIIETVQ